MREAKTSSKLASWWESFIVIRNEQITFDNGLQERD
jgi:hypothetical protein